MKVEDLFKIRKLRKIVPDFEKAKSSLLIAENKLNQAKELHLAGFFEQSILNAYSSMFHSARALLYRDGVQEKGHFAVYVYLAEEYNDKIPVSLLNSFFNYQNERKDILYGLEKMDLNEEESKDALDCAEEFLSLSGRLLNG